MSLWGKNIYQIKRAVDANRHHIFILRLLRTRVHSCWNWQYNIKNEFVAVDCKIQPAPI
jgi:hypothetical protein